MVGKRKIILEIIFILCITISACETSKNAPEYESAELVIEQLTDHTFIHISYLNTNDFGKVRCNGLVVREGEKALIIDAPTNSIASLELINWIEKEIECEIVGVVVSHFHEDALGDLGEFHKRGISSYSNTLTIELAQSDSSRVLPTTGFSERLEIAIQNQQVANEYFGRGHTKDNIVSYFPNEKVLYGGCLIKSLQAGKGYLGDADTTEWSKTVQKVKARYTDVEFVVPGHGKPGGSELLDYTIQLFEVEP